MSNYQERLQQEIERVGVTHLSRKLGIARNTLYNWSEKANVPLDKLMAMGEHGLDVTFIITGNHELSAQYSEQDIAITNSIKKLDPTTRSFILKGLGL
ncbi:helix-turn-helix domain-containing protein [Kingella kingae]|uniref:helix-turn-helix domain-containing protein n=1 Tax=Kingella kingae TaxID=504 RepID=UPI001070FD8E|nr:helix-turn-helix domain-containing protein [Kingella kingae]MBD3614238.1 helix-turn-helix domain-containing protein [Kingella kingae]MBD3632816.1 helix-turn-helix domain-containing protein [Kingella kingae]MBD3658884.1 helix-turn-helix domain-containing protein [Kingella kingae]MDK4529697.1 helix-turn-helix domain-containing protein [Kingella kingae]MDK4630247.1 helix-turn-helix domain-containing protein [Kingella kingae]